ncbi:MAG TPA: 30S ribosomal protein S12 methylthiotransferase RimO [Acidimicrobiales bacterium]|nr:30S ribosomal protein S12 methylthiotransferase RimO [Acidimicrobiales bacterium]
MPETFWLETLGCPKNQVDSDKLAGTLVADGYEAAGGPEDADLVVVNTCAFIEAARQESIDTILDLADSRRAGSRLVVTGCLAERYGPELSEALPEVDLVAGFGVPVTLRRRNAFDLLNLPRPAAQAPWAYVKVAEGCDRRCGFCAIPSFRGRQRSRPTDSVLDEVDALGDGVREVVLVAQDLASWGLDRSAADRVPRTRGTPRPIVELIRAVAGRVERVRLLYLYPSALDDELVDTIVASGVPYFDLSLQHVSRPLVERMRRWGDGTRFLERIARIRTTAPDAALRSSFILGYPGETEEDHDALLDFLAEARLDWAGFFTFSEEPGTYAAGLGDAVPRELALERLRECSEVQDRITAERRAALVGTTMRVLVDGPGAARSHREAPEIDGIVHVPATLEAGHLLDVVATGAAGPDLWADMAGPVDR